MTTSLRTSATALLALMAFTTTPDRASAQTIVGRVVDAESEEPVPQAQVHALDASESRVRSARSTSEGAFELRLDVAGTYTLRVERIGYPTQVVAEVTLGLLEQVELLVRLRAEPIPLPPLTVTGRGPERGRHGFERRRDLGSGVFLNPIHVALKTPREVTDVLRGVEGIEIDHQRDIQALRGWGCMVVFLDHMRLPVMRTGGEDDGGRLALGGHMHLNEFVDPTTVRAVEVYRSIDEVPEELRQGVLWQDVDRCGVVWVWTRQGW